MTTSNQYPLWPNRYRPQTKGGSVNTKLVASMATSTDPDYTTQSVLVTKRALSKLRKVQTAENIHEALNVSPDDMSFAELQANILFNKHKSKKQRTRIKPHHFVHDRFDYGRTNGNTNIDPSWYNDGDGPELVGESMYSALYGMDDKMVAHSTFVIDPLQVWKKAQELSVKYPLQEEFSREATLNWFEQELGCECDYIDEYGNAYYGVCRQFIQDYGVDGNPMTHTTAWGE